jgi:chromosomal replication initiation ATPase DnaA
LLAAARRHGDDMPAVDSIVAQVANYYGVRLEDVLARGRKNNRERDVAIYLARELAGLRSQIANNE